MINRFNGNFRFLSNFYLSPITVSGKSWPSVEHYYQAMKTISASDQETIRNLSTPGQAKRYGKTITLRPDWEDIKLSVMEYALRRKFVKGGILAIWLVETTPHELIEGNTWNDIYWGMCNGVGQNNLGKLLMKIREELKGGDYNRILITK